MKLGDQEMTIHNTDVRKKLQSLLKHFTDL